MGCEEDDAGPTARPVQGRFSNGVNQGIPLCTWLVIQIMPILLSLEVLGLRMTGPWSCVGPVTVHVGDCGGSCETILVHVGDCGGSCRGLWWFM
jgi:hypothetical protein